MSISCIMCYTCKLSLGLNWLNLGNPILHPWHAQHALISVIITQD